MKTLVLGCREIVLGAGSLEHLKNVTAERVFIVTGGSSMIKHGIIDRAKQYLDDGKREILVHSGISPNPTISEITEGITLINSFKPDMVIGIGGGSAMDAAKAMILFYEFPELNFNNVLAHVAENKIPAERKKAKLICVPSTSGSASEVTKGTVVTDPGRHLKFPILTACIRPDVAILDSDLTKTMPANIVAETGLDALTHAVEAYINHSMDDFDEALAAFAAIGIMKWLPKSFNEADAESRGKIHNYQAMAGIAFANVGLGMVHGIAHAFGGMYDIGHGVANAIVLPYALDYNKRNDVVSAKLKELSYLCRCDDIISEIKKLKKDIGIPLCFKEFGVSESDYKKDFDILLKHTMAGGATKANPILMTDESMSKMLDAVYYGTPIDF